MSADRRVREEPDRRLVLVLLLGAAAVFGLLAVGGYGLGWRWTGLSRSVTLWDWLQMLALPVALGLAPVLLQHRRRLTRRHRTVVAMLLVLFAVLVSLGYLVPLPWTGFTGNTLWDWLELALLPLVVGTASLWADRGQPSRRWRIAVWVGLLAFGAVVLAGYLVPWAWTGFRGNTAWDWVKLLLLPVIVPTVLIPTVVRLVTERVVPADEN
jgi:peptidoglycan/LPS O-acetylase OafA/YrhL